MHFSSMGKQTMHFSSMGKQTMHFSSMGKQTMHFSSMGKQTMHFSSMGKQTMHFSSMDISLTYKHVQKVEDHVPCLHSVSTIIATPRYMNESGLRCVKRRLPFTMHATHVSSISKPAFRPYLFLDARTLATLVSHGSDSSSGLLEKYYTGLELKDECSPLSCSCYKTTCRQATFHAMWTITIKSHNSVVSNLKPGFTTGKNLHDDVNGWY